MTDLVLPAFELDCRDWIVISPAEAGLPDDGDVPMLAVLSTMVVDDDIREATGSLSVGLIDDDDLAVRPVGVGCVAHELLDFDPVPGTRRYVMQAPGQQLALLAEFLVEDDVDGVLESRVHTLMGSFRWQSD